MKHIFINYHSIKMDAFVRIDNDTIVGKTVPLMNGRNTK